MGIYRVGGLFGIVGNVIQQIAAGAQLAFQFADRLGVRVTAAVAQPVQAVSNRCPAGPLEWTTMQVFVVYTEYQNGDPAIIGVFETQADAHAAVAKEIDTQETEYHNRVLNHVPVGVDADDYDESEWDVDVHVEAHELIRTAVRA